MWTKNLSRNQKREIEESPRPVNLGTDFRDCDHVPQEQNKQTNKKRRERNKKENTIHPLSDDERTRQSPETQEVSLPSPPPLPVCVEQGEEPAVKKKKKTASSLARDLEQCLLPTGVTELRAEVKSETLEEGDGRGRS